MVFGGSTELRGLVSGAAEGVKARLLGLLQAPDRWKIPILINLQMPQANLPEVGPAALRFSQTGAGLKIQVDLLVPRKFDPATLTHEVTRALLLEMTYRASPELPAGQPYTPPPEWLVEGLEGADNNGEPLPATNFMTLAKLLQQDPALLDSQSQLLYRAQASVLTRTLATMPGGASALKALILNLPQARGDPLADLQRHFSSLGSTPEEMEKTWQKTLARTSTGQSSVLDAFATTGSALDEILKTKIADNGKTSFLEACRNSRTRVEAKAAQTLSQNLMLLSARAHPLLRPVMLEYEQMSEALSKNRRRGVAARAKRAADLRAKLQSRMESVDDYLNWFEATQAADSSGQFSGYLRAAENLEAVSRRHDPLSVYLDAMDAQVQ